MISKNLNSFLEFGYFLDYKNPIYEMDFSKTDKYKYINCTEEELIQEGIFHWEKNIEERFELTDKHVVPLSGGLDSRAILSALLKLTDAKNIYTFTYGAPGTFDYDIGNQIAEKIGTRHLKLPLTEYNYNIDSLVDISRRVAHQTILFHHGPVGLIDKEFKGANIWSGAIIDVFFGRHHHVRKANNWKDAIINSFYENQYVKSIKLSNCEYSEMIPLVQYDEKLENIFEREHVIDLMNRQVKFIAPHVLMDGLSYTTLFNSELSDFANCIPNNYRENQYLYKKIFINAYPELFSIRTKTNHGLNLNASKLSIFFKRFQNKLSKTLGYQDANSNYLDFNKSIRTKKDLKNVVATNIMDLKSRKLIDWVDIEEILNNHLTQKGDFADALIVLASLEIHLKAGKKL